MANVLPLYYGGQEVASTATETLDVLNPATQELIMKVPCTTQSEMEAIVANAAEAQKRWREVPVQQRARVLMKLHTLLNEHKDEIAWSIVKENGKTKPDADGDVFRGIEVVEHAIGMPALMMGEAMETISRNMDTVTMKQPLGIIAGIAPFNFPAMIPLWMLPIAVGTGNAFILKPSEKVPTASMMIAKLATKAGLPDGIFNIIHGGKDAVNFLCDCPQVKAVSFVGSGSAHPPPTTTTSPPPSPPPPPPPPPPHSPHPQPLPPPPALPPYLETTPHPPLIPRPPSPQPTTQPRPYPLVYGPLTL
jgi:malonate-semialdehyde dehydrogenase (acetylating)/methylmalonate-semialdehyde dehydrogenase